MKYYPPEISKLPFIVAVSGGRQYRDRERVFAVLDRVHKTSTIDLLIQGECTSGGADLYARLWAKAREVNSLSIPAKWLRFPDNPDWRYRAGPVRNFEMSTWKPDLWIFFPGGSGTEDAFGVARRANIKRRRVK